MDDNPLIARNRFHNGSQYGNTATDPIIVEDGVETFSLLQFIKSLYMTLLTLLKNKLRLTGFLGRYNPLSTADLKARPSLSVRSLSLSPDLQSDSTTPRFASTPTKYTSVTPALLTDDYNRINPQPVYANSIIIDDGDEFDEESDSESFSQLLKKLVSQKTSPATNGNNSSQYGTDLSISVNHMMNSSYQTNYFPNVIKASNNTNFQDMNQSILMKDDQYRSSIINYYNRYIPQPPKSYSFIDDIIPNYHIDTQISDNYKQNQLSNIAKVENERLKSKSVIKSLDSNQLNQVQSIWNCQTNKLIVSNFQIDIKVSDLQTLSDGKWLNDNIIDYYINLIMMNNSRVFGWTTHFYSTLQSKGYQGVSRWAKRKKVNLFEKDIIIIPINIHNYHWALSIINNKEQTITYYDSIASSGTTRVLHDLQDYMNSEAQRLGLNKVNYALNFNGKSPQQSNGSDCGVFTCTNAKLLANDQLLNYSQKDMKTIRRRMVYEISSKQLLN